MLLASIIKEQKKPQAPQTSSLLTDALLRSLPMREGSVLVVDAPPPDENAVFRMSGLAMLCPRMYALAMRDEISLKDKLDPEKRWIFGTGTAFHTQFQEDYLRTLGDVFQGWWRCRHCSREHRGEPLEGMLPNMWIPIPKECGGCKANMLPHEHSDYEYVELEFEDKEHRITGHCDGILDWNYWPVNEGDEIRPGANPDLVETLELKTINENGFNYVDPKVGGKPRGGHIIQTSGYQWGVEATGVSRVRLVYIKKSFEPMVTVLCEHVLERNQEYIDLIKQMLKDSIAALKAVAEHRKLTVLDGADPGELEIPERLTACGKKADYRAKYCPTRDPCFVRKKKAAKKAAKAAT